MSLSELARRSGVAPQALRLYEARNLLRPSPSGRERRYGERDLVRLQVVLKAKKLGLSLEEARRMILDKDPVAPTGCSIEQMEARLMLLQEQRRGLDAAIRELHDMLTLPASDCAAAPVHPDAPAPTR